MTEIKVHCKHVKIMNVEDIKPNPANPNTHPEIQIAMLAKNIREFGWRHPVIVSNLSGLVVAGHARLEAAKLLNCKVPVDYQDFKSKSEETACLIADNRLAELAEMNNSALKDLLQELDTGEMDMDLTGYSAEELERLMTQFHNPKLDDIGFQDDKNDKLKVVLTFPQSKKDEFTEIIRKIKEQYSWVNVYE